VAIYHFSAKVIGRGVGRSTVAAAAYRAAERLHDERLGRDHDFTAKAGVVHSEILIPEGAPERWQDRAALWNEVEVTERRRDAQLARDVEIALPRELSRAEAVALARDFVGQEFVSRGMVADLNVHWGMGRDGEAQPHAHVMLTMRRVEGDGFGPKERDWNGRELLTGWRERWAELVNQRLAELGHDACIDHRSLAAQGIALEPQHKVGPAGQRRTERGEGAERRAEHDDIARRNGERIAADPAVALDALTRQQSTFTRHDLARFVSRHTDGTEQFASVLAKVEASPELVRVGKDGRGRERFSTREMLTAEQRMEAAGAALARSAGHHVRVAGIDRAVRLAEETGLRLGEEQRGAVAHVTAGRDLALVVGYAGTGKSAMLGVAREAWEAQGYRVRGAALSGIAAEGLEAGSGIRSRTLASLEWGWKEGREGDRLTSCDVLVVDEAGMVGSRQMERVLSAAHEAGAKVVLVGDPEQLQAIEAGAAFRALAERHGAAEIAEVRRQREEWQREATRELATGHTEAALDRYERVGMVRGHATQEEARAAVVAGWAVERQESPHASRIMLAHTRADVAALNELARKRLREAGELGEERQVATERGERAMAAGDRVMFLRNERALGAGLDGRGGVAVKNGTLGTVLAVEAGGERLRVALDGASGPAGQGKAVTFSLSDYGHLDHGYAATVHKSQGVTVDRAHVLAGAGMDRHMAYVALTRHRESVELHWSAEAMGSREGLARALSRERAKDTTLDYAGPGREGSDDGARHAAAFAERRGLHPLAPVSEIVVERPERGPEPEASVAAGTARDVPRRGRFAGLRLGAGQGAPRPILEQAPEPTPEPASASRPEAALAETRGERLTRGLAGYARAWADAVRMGQAGLPVLPHQTAALARAGKVLEAEGASMARDAVAVLTRDPSLAGLAAGGRAADVALFGRAVGQERRSRQALEERGRGAVRSWDALEQAHDQAAGRYEWDAAREATKKLEAFARELKRDPQLDSLLRERGRELGVAEGSRLERVLAMDEVAVKRALAQELRLEQAPRQGRSMGLGM
jgi:Ti-type conjugative transfer relaxase TraA